jgi:hypothetical protein
VVIFDVKASDGVLIDEATISLTGGMGYSPNQPWSGADLDGRVSAGGDATVRLSALPPANVCIWNASLTLRGGDGGKAPDGWVPHYHNTGGKAGGYSAGGDVKGHVGAGGGVDLVLEGDTVDIGQTSFDLLGGRGGDAGDVNFTEYGPQAGTGGGGYSGGRGADGLRRMTADAGGDISGDVGSGGEATFSVTAGDIYGESIDLTVVGGNGGDAGDGGINEAISGTGGGGYSGGGGGSYYGGKGGDGGNVSEQVGSGGDARCLLTLTGAARLVDATLDLQAGDGGDAGDGGSTFNWRGGGAGGGGYSAGGGGGTGAGNGVTPGQDGGEGWTIRGDVGTGGDAVLSVDSPRLEGRNLTLGLHGGDGGDGGTNGSRDNDVNGGGGGAYSSGGGGGSSQADKPNGAGGQGGRVTGSVGDGGAALLSFDTPWFGLDDASSINATSGRGGNGKDADAVGLEGGGGNGRVTSDGLEVDHIPMSIPILINPQHRYHQTIGPLEFEWSTAHDSTTNGTVASYAFMLDDDPGFSSPEFHVAQDYVGYVIADLPFGHYYWRVKAVYSRPLGSTPGWSDTNLLRWGDNNPIELVLPIDDVTLNKSVVDVPVFNLNDHFADPDDDLLLFHCTGNEFISVEVHDNGSVVMTPAPGWIGVEHITFIAKDWVDVPTRANGTCKVTVVGVNHPPIITTRGIPDGVEDVPYEVTFEAFDEDVVDRRLWEVTSSAGFLRMHATTGRLHGTPLNEDVGTHWANVSVRDYQTSDHINVTFIVGNVNDPPVIITEDVTACVDGTEYLVDYEARDVDPTEDPLTWALWTNASFLSLDNGTGVLRGTPDWEDFGVYWVNVSVADDKGGSSFTRFELRVNPHDLPPEVERVPTLEVIEEMAHVVDLAAYISDVDTPPEELTLECTHPGVHGIDGLRITFVYGTWVPQHVVRFHVLDAHWRVEGTIPVRVLPIDDIPIIGELPTLNVTEGEDAFFDLTPYVSDEDTPLHLLVLDSDHPAVVSIDGLAVTLNFADADMASIVSLTVSDETSGSVGVLEVDVSPVNDPPVIIGLGDERPPLDLTVEEGTTVYLNVRVEDDDGDPIDIELVTGLPWVVLHDNGTLQVSAAKGAGGEYSFGIIAKDPHGGEAFEEVSLLIIDINDPPVIVAVMPRSGSFFDRGDTVELRVQATDEDGDLLLYSWHIGDRTVGLGERIELEDLEIGEHNITLTVEDGNGGFATTNVIIEVLDPGVDSSMLLLLLTVLVVVVGVVLILTSRKSGVSRE